MYSLKSILKTIAKQLLVVYVCYTLCRILFLIFNKNYFQEIEWNDTFAVLFYGLRFDSFSIAATNALYLILALLPFQFYATTWYQKVLKTVFDLVIEKEPYFGILDHFCNSFFRNLRDGTNEKAKDFLRDYCKENFSDSNKMNVIVDIIRHSMKDMYDEILLLFSKSW